MGCSTPMDKGSPTKFEGHVEQVNKTEKKRWELRVKLTSRKLNRKYSLDIRKRRKAQIKAKIRQAKLRSQYESDTTWSGSESDLSLSDSASYTTVTNDSPSASELVVTKSQNTDHMYGHKDSTDEHESSEQSENTESRPKNVGEVDVSERNVMNNNEEDDNSSGKLFV